MNFAIKHSGSAFIETTTIEWASPLTRTEADTYALTVEQALDGTTGREHFAEVHELEKEHREALEAARKRADVVAVASDPAAGSRVIDAMEKSNALLGQIADLLGKLAGSIDELDARVRQVEEIRQVVSKRSKAREARP